MHLHAGALDSAHSESQREKGIGGAPMSTFFRVPASGEDTVELIPRQCFLNLALDTFSTAFYHRDGENAAHDFSIIVLMLFENAFFITFLSGPASASEGTVSTLSHFWSIQ